MQPTIITFTTDWPIDSSIISEWLIEWVSEWVCEWESQWVSESVSQSVSESVNESGVPNDHFWQNCSYNVTATIGMFLRQSSLIFNVPGKKIPALHCQRARVSGNKTPSQPSCETAFNQPAYFKMRNDTYCQRAHNVCQRAVAYVMSQPARFQHQ